MVQTPFGRRLRARRREAGLSQLELAIRAGSSQRHLSFLETGRSHPRPSMVRRLAEVLGMPPRERDHWLRLAGHGPEGTTQVSEPTAPFLAALQGLLEQHDPLPAYVLDGWWDIRSANAGATDWFGDVLGPGDNLIEALFEGRLRRAIDNWSTVAVATLARLEREQLSSPLDARMEELLGRARSAVGGRRPGPRPDAPVVSLDLRLGAERVRVFTLVTRFGAADVPELSELRAELMVPRDPHSDRVLRGGRSRP